MGIFMDIQKVKNRPWTAPGNLVRCNSGKRQDPYMVMIQKEYECVQWL